jgi:hypothetical protein
MPSFSLHLALTCNLLTGVTSSSFGTRNSSNHFVTAKQYGDVFSLTVLHKTIIVLNTPSAVREIIDKRSNSSSNRPRSIVINSIVPPGTNFGMSEVGAELEIYYPTVLPHKPPFS